MANRASRYGPGSQSENTPMDNVLMHHRNYFDIKAWQILMQSALDFQIYLTNVQHELRLIFTRHQEMIKRNHSI